MKYRTPLFCYLALEKQRKKHVRNVYEIIKYSINNNNNSEEEEKSLLYFRWFVYDACMFCFSLQQQRNEASGGGGGAESRAI